MSTALAKPKQQKKRYLSGTPNYMTLLPPGRIIAEKMFEMGIDATELARRMKISGETVAKLLRFEIPLTEGVAKKLERATLMPADVMMRFEKIYRDDIEQAMEHPEIPAYLAGKIINKPKRTNRKKA